MLRTVVILSIVGSFVLPSEAATQIADGGVSYRLQELRLEPAAPAFAQPFEVHIALRVGPSAAVALSDTLLPSAGARSIGPGTWTAEPAPGDSLDLVAVYPVIAFDDELVELPWLELLIQEGVAGRAASPGGAVPGIGPGEAVPRYLELGEVEVAPLFGEAEDPNDLALRPPLDVRGGEWSIWFLLAVGVSIAGVGGLGLLPRWLARSNGDGSARRTALRELDQIMAEWQRHGRVDDFYAATTGTLRRFAMQIDPEWVLALTSSELLPRLEARWGAAKTESLGRSVLRGERVKFGPYRPDPATAKDDWKIVRDWIENVTH